MSLPSKEYWARRLAERMTDYTADAERTANKIGAAYYKAGKYLSGEAGKAVKNFGKAFDLSEAEALRLLKNLPDKSMAGRLKAAVANISDPGKRKQAEAVISSPAYAYRIQRLREVEEGIRTSCSDLYSAELKADKNFFGALPDKAYKMTVFDVQKATGISSAFSRFPKSRVDKILSTNWSGQHFSQRVWSNTNALADGLQHDMLVGIMAGKSEVHMAEDIMNRMGSGAFEARRLVRTETTYIANQAELEGYKECDIEKYEFSACLDSRTSEICAGLDGKVFDLKDATAGSNLPPMHPFCRSTTLPVLPDEEELDRQIKETGDEIGADVSFDEWQKNLVETEDGKLIYRVDKAGKSGIIGNEKYATIEGKNVVGEWNRRSEFDSAIDDIIDYQGFNGKPYVVNNKAEFETLVTDDHFIGERTIRADTQEELDKYLWQLKKDYFYVNCNVGGAQYGQGMYCAADYAKGAVAKSAFEHEISQYASNSGSTNKLHTTVWLTMDKSANILKLPKGKKAAEYIANEYQYAYLRKFATAEQKRFVEDYISAARQTENLTFSEPKEIIDDLYGKRNKAADKIRDLINKSFSYSADKDAGVMAAEMGYDAINAEGHGETGSYTVVLNRTKLIIYGGDDYVYNPK